MTLFLNCDILIATKFSNCDILFKFDPSFKLWQIFITNTFTFNTFYKFDFFQTVTDFLIIIQFFVTHFLKCDLFFQLWHIFYNGDSLLTQLWHHLLSVIHLHTFKCDPSLNCETFLIVTPFFKQWHAFLSVTNFFNYKTFL